MKKLLGLIVCMLLTVSAMCARDRVSRDVNLLPTEARELIKNHFAEASISYLKVDKNLFRVEGYDVRLTDGTELDFNSKGQWTEIEAEKNAVPASLIPDVIKKYMKQNYNGQRVKKIKHNRRGYELKLSNGLEVEFDNMGNFLRLDD
ncbi:MAG: PepSY-like domain-containing protein [Bacteroidaceae bacterium]|nr:PepSY-like domain-containing protein [Bacteroidaceae bacterium]